MSDNERSRGSFPPLLAGLIGLIVGGAIAGGLLGALMLRQQARHEAQLAAVTAQTADVGGALRGAANMFDTRDDDEQRVRKIGNEFVEDLENNRLTSAYRLMAPDFQAKTDRKAFEAMIAQYPSVRTIIYGSSTMKVRKGVDPQTYEYYLTATDRNATTNQNKVNFAITFVRVNDEWRISEFEITADARPMK
jgi:hypothetical protein